MASNIIRHGLCVTLLAAFAVFGTAACGASDGSDDWHEEDASRENVGESTEAIQCGYQGWPGAHCLGHCKSWADGHWEDLGVPASCHQMVNDYCEWRGGNGGECWGWL